MEKKIVVIEEADGSQNVQQYLAGNNGYNILRVNSIIEFHSIAAQNPDVIILDDQMAGGSTGQLFALLKSHRQTRHIPVIMLSAAKEPALIDHYRPDDILLKPFIPTQLLSKVEFWLGNVAGLN